MAQEVPPIQKQSAFRCPVCGAEFTTRRQLEDHGRQEHGTAASASPAGPSARRRP